MTKQVTTYRRGRPQRAWKFFAAAGLLVVLACGLVFGAKAPARYRLYTQPDFSSPGGIEGRVKNPALPIVQVLAIPPDAPEMCYQGEVTGPDKQGFKFTGLPMRKYDLIIIYDEQFYEGLQLNRGKSTLSFEDEEKINDIVMKSEPFFNVKTIHRMGGETGRGNMARCICTFLRNTKSELLMEAYEGKFERKDWRRTFKLVVLKDVGPGWQVARARDLYPVWATPQSRLPEHFFTESISGIRVADSIKNLGELDLAR